MGSWFTSIGIDIANSRETFRLLDISGNEELNMHEFMTGCLNLLGGAKAVDTKTVLKNTKAMIEQIKHVGHHVGRTELAIDHFSQNVGSRLDATDLTVRHLSEKLEHRVGSLPRRSRMSVKKKKSL